MERACLQGAGGWPSSPLALWGAWPMLTLGWALSQLFTCGVLLGRRSNHRTRVAQLTGSRSGLLTAHCPPQPWFLIIWGNPASCPRLGALGQESCTAVESGDVGLLATVMLQTGDWRLQPGQVRGFRRSQGGELEQLSGPGPPRLLLAI